MMNMAKINLEELLKNKAHLKLIGIYMRNKFEGNLLDTVRFYFSSKHFHGFDKYFYTHRDVPQEQRAKRYYEDHGK